MSTQKKLQSEIDACLKKTQEGMAVFEEIWDKVHSASTPAQKEKYESELKREIKKLQRLRENIKTWITSDQVKDKQPLLDARKEIEKDMERFKYCEKETKTKAFSKEGLAAASRLDPEARRKQETRDWVDQCISTFESQVDQFESEIETLRSKRKGSKKTEREEQLNESITQHRYHVRSLEQALRLMENDQLSVDLVRSVEEDVEYYLEANQEPDFCGDENLYDVLNLDSAGAGFDDIEVIAAASAAKISEDEAKAAKKAEKAEREAEAERKAQEAKARVEAQARAEQQRAQAAAIAAANASPAKGATAAAVAGRGAGAAGLTRAQQQAQAQAAAQAQRQQQQQQQQAAAQAKVQQQQQAQMAAKAQQQAQQQGMGRGAAPGAGGPAAAGRGQDPRTMQAQQAAQRQQSAQQQQLAMQQQLQQQQMMAQLQAQQQMGGAGGAMRRPSDGDGGAGDAAEAVGQLSLGGGEHEAWHRESASLLDASFRNMPAPVEPERPRQPFDNPVLFERLEPDTLFFIFYYQPGTYQQYLAARELKKQGWRFHKKYLTWFQRHEEPVETSNDHEQGTYVYFDYETGWCQRIKSEFMFEYVFLEDELAT